MFRNPSEDKLRKSALNEKMSTKACFACAAAATVCMLGGAAVLSFGAVGIIAAVPLGVFSAVACAMLFCYGKGLFCAVPALCTAVSFAFGAAGALFSVLGIVCGLCIALCIASRRKRFETVLWITVSACAVLCLAFAFTVYLSEGGVTRDHFNGYIGRLSGELSAAYLQAVEDLRYIFTEAGAINEEMSAQLDRLSADDYVDAIGKGIVVSLPAYVGAAVSVFSYGVFALFLMTSQKVGKKLFAFRIFAVPTFLAHLYMIFSFASVFFSSETVVGLFMRYITVLLTPCFAYLGIRGIIALLRSGAPVGIRVGAAVLCVLMLPMLTYLITLLAFLGAYIVMRTALERRVRRN